MWQFRWNPTESCGSVEKLRSAQLAQSILQRFVLGLVIVLGVEILNLSFRQIQLRLGELDDGGQAEVVPALREI